MKVQREKDLLTLKDLSSEVLLFVLKLGYAMNFLIHSSNEKIKVGACILFAVNLPASKKKTNSLSEAYVTQNLKTALKH